MQVVNLALFLSCYVLRKRSIVSKLLRFAFLRVDSCVCGFWQADYFLYASLDMRDAETKAMWLKCSRTTIVHTH